LFVTGIYSLKSSRPQLQKHMFGFDPEILLRKIQLDSQLLCRSLLTNSHMCPIPHSDGGYLLPQIGIDSSAVIVFRLLPPMMGSCSGLWAVSRF
jgi:hypothetical protein